MLFSVFLFFLGGDSKQKETNSQMGQQNFFLYIFTLEERKKHDEKEKSEV